MYDRPPTLPFGGHGGGTGAGTPVVLKRGVWVFFKNRGVCLISEHPSISRLRGGLAVLL
jgi:hypothetical protein